MIYIVWYLTEILSELTNSVLMNVVIALGNIGVDFDKKRERLITFTNYG